MNQEEQYVIIGAGISGINAAVALRFEGFKGRVILIDKDRDIPYDRPPLSKEFLSGKVDENEILLYAPEFFKKNEIELKLRNKVMEIDVEIQKIKLGNDEIIFWDKILLATGSQLKRLNIPGKELEHIHYLRTKEDSKQLKDHLQDVEDIVVIGAGFIGSEVAATCREMGINVTIIEALPIPLGRVLGDDMGEFIADVHRSNGVDLITNEYVTEFKGTESVEEVITSTGKRIQCQAVVVGIGVELDLHLVNGTPIKTDGGIEVDEFCETNISGVFAAGDCALWPYNREMIRVEHWDHAMKQARTAAKNMLNSKSHVYNTIPYFWSDQYNIKIQYLGNAKTWEETVLRGSVEEREFTMFYIYNNKIVSALFVNSPKNVLPTRKLITQNTQITDFNELANGKKSLKKMLSKKSREI